MVDLSHACTQTGAADFGVACGSGELAGIGAGREESGGGVCETEQRKEDVIGTTKEFVFDG